MGYKTKDELTQALTDFSTYFQYPVPESFPVHDDYLIDGLTVTDFNRCYEIYRRKMIDIQLAVIADPDAFGMIETTKKGEIKPAYSMANAYIWLFLALAKSSDVRNGVMYVDNDKFTAYCNGAKLGKNTAKPKNVDVLINKLNDFGFTITDDLRITSDVDGLCAAIKASTLTPYAGTSMTSDYPTFNYRMYKYGIDETLPFEETMSYVLMSDQKKEFTSKLIAEMRNCGWKSYIFFPHSLHGGRLTFPTVEYYYNVYGDSHVLLRITKGFDFLAYMKTLPERYYNYWKSTKTCRGCKKGECAGRKIDESWFGNRKPLCTGNVKVVYECEIDDIPYIVDAALRTAGKKVEIV